MCMGNSGERLSQLDETSRTCWFDPRPSCLPLSCVVSQSPGLLKTLHVLEDPAVFLPSLRRQEAPGVEYPCLHPSIQHRPPNCELLLRLVTSGEPPSPTTWLLDAISSHTPRAPGSLTEGGWPSQFPFWAIKKELFSQPRSAHLKRGFRTKGEWEYREEGQKNPERNTCDATLVPLYQNAVTRIQNT